MPDSAKVKFVQENLAKFSIITFFKKYSYLHSSRNAAQEDLRKCLEIISHTGKAKEANIAKSYLANNLDNMFKSKLAEDFWRKLELGQLEEKVKFSKEKHNKTLIINVYREHDAISGLVTSETEGLSQQHRVSSSNDDVLSDFSNDKDLSNDNGPSNDDNLFNNDDNDYLSNDNNDDFSNGGKDKEYEGDVDVTDLREPHVMEAETGKELTSDEWAEVHALVESYRLKIPKTRCLYNPLFYHIVDHSGQHGPTTKLLNRYMSSMRRSLPNVSFDLPSLSDGQDKFFDELFAAEDLQDIRASTPEQRTVKKLVYRINDAINCPNKDVISEYEHTMRNVIPFIDASIRDMPDYVIQYFESTLRATAIRRNSGGDPTERAQMGYRVDVLIKFNGLHWSPDLGCGEVSGGLPRCTSAKEWMDTLKLGWELRDVWVLTQDQLNGVDASALVVWGFTVVARTIRIYALTAAGGLFHLILAYEAPIPSSRWDICNTKIAYCTMLGFLQKLDATKKMLINLNSERTKILCTGVKRKKMSALFCSPPITGSPAKKKKK